MSSFNLNCNFLKIFLQYVQLKSCLHVYNANEKKLIRLYISTQKNCLVHCEIISFISLMRNG